MEKWVLPNASDEKIQDLLKARGINRKMLYVPHMLPKDILRVKTDSGNYYLFEFTDPKQCLAHVFRLQPRPKALKTGYIGKRIITDMVKVEKNIWHDDSVTSPVAEIVLIRRKDENL